MLRVVTYLAGAAVSASAVLGSSQIRTPLSHRNVVPPSIGYDALAKRTDWLSLIPKTASAIGGCYGNLMPFDRAAYVFRVTVDGDNVLIWFATGSKPHLKEIACSTSISDMMAKSSVMEADSSQELDVKPPYYADEAKHLPTTNGLQLRKVIGYFNLEQGVVAF